MHLARPLLLVSVIALIAAPVVLLLSAFSINGACIAAALFIIGALGLFAGMKALAKQGRSDT